MSTTPVVIAVLNESTVVSDAEVIKVVAALQVQVSQHFAPVWGLDATILFVPKGSSPPQGAWWLTVLDNSDQAGALGYHDLTNEGLPLGKVFAGTDLQYGQQWSVTASHELLEMLADPNINLAATVEPGRSGSVMTLYGYEVADACEADEDGYRIGDVLVSDFVFPSWFESFWIDSTTPLPQFDQKGMINRPFQLLPGGYISVYDVNSGQGWSQIHADDARRKYTSRAHVGSRRERRRTNRSLWMRSQSGRAARAGSGVCLIASSTVGGTTSVGVPSATDAKEVGLTNTATDIQPVPVARAGSNPGIGVLARTVAARRLLADQEEQNFRQRRRAFLSQVHNPTEPPVGRRAGREPSARLTIRSAAAAGSGIGQTRPLRILAQGDSWFEYPCPAFSGDGVIVQLEPLLGFQLLNLTNLAHHGWEVRQMLGLEQRERLISELQNHSDIRYDALLFSGGGNDLCGDQLITFLNEFGGIPTTAGDMIDMGSLNSALDLLMSEYIELIAIRDNFSPGTVIFVNCYDFPPITGKPVDVVFGVGPGPWLRPSLVYAYQHRGVSSPSDGDMFAIVATILGTFSQRLKALVTPTNDFLVVPTQNTLDSSFTSADWQNELHPSTRGFVTIAEKFKVALEQEFG